LSVMLAGSEPQFVPRTVSSIGSPSQADVLLGVHVTVTHGPALQRTSANVVFSIESGTPPFAKSTQGSLKTATTFALLRTEPKHSALAFTRKLTVRVAPTGITRSLNVRC